MATELVTGCWWLDLGSVNAYLIEDGVPTLVDAGTPWDETAIRDDLAETGTAVSDVGRVLLTHYDVDHVGTLGALAGEMDATVYAGAADAAMLAGERSPSATNAKGLLQRVTGPFVEAPHLHVETVADGDRIGSFTAYETPGHTPGHLAYVSETLGIGVLGDLVVEDDGDLSASPWFLSYDSDAVRASIRRLAAEAPPFEVLCLGHGEPMAEGGSDALRNLAAET